MTAQSNLIQRTLLVLTTTIFLPGMVIAQQADTPTNAEDQVKVMSFNIRYGTARDGDNHWNNRHELVIQTIQQDSPDLLGTQETLKFQADYLRQNLPDYAWFGRGRESDPNQGEQCAVFYRKSRFTKLAEGHFWLSPKPDKPGSRGWDAALPRMVTWLKLRDRQANQTLFWFNTHFDHRGPNARVESARLLAKKVREIAGQDYFVVTGDFNAKAESKPYLAMFGQRDGAESVMVDTFRKANGKQIQNEGTFNGFKGTRSGGRIDWIASSPRFKILAAGIDDFEVDGQYPSDHFPVTATLRYTK
ncbi:MAG: endonuclease/exonuclease/phosphatase family protein [Planctomycetota bacterium]|nr:endonuclease/exonuclease/phosphatase family protein [Planctomycetota bacterium]